MSMTVEEFGKALELNEEIREIKGCIGKLKYHNADSFILAWGNMYNGMNEKVEIPSDIEKEIVKKIYDWYKNRLKEAEDEFSELVTRE